jgi:hypothetical protein
MCKAKIEKAARDAGATYALWDVEKKELTVKYSSSTTNTAKIQQKIADVGYDNAGFKAKTESYESLHACCKYERGKDVNTSAQMSGSEMDCCKDGKCTKPGHNGKNCCKKDDSQVMDCCKDGKCTKEGHDGKDCCKKQ